MLSLRDALRGRAANAVAQMKFSGQRFGLSGSNGAQRVPAVALRNAVEHTGTILRRPSLLRCQ